MTKYTLTRQVVEEHYHNASGSPTLRVWITQRQDHMAYYYVSSVTEAVDVLDEYADGALAAGLEELDERDGWVTWLDDRGCDIDELLEEREADPENWAAEYAG